MDNYTAEPRGSGHRGGPEPDLGRSGKAYWRSWWLKELKDVHELSGWSDLGR